jgi:hypothetical protein
MDLKVAGVDIIRSSKGFIACKLISRIRRIEGATNKDIAGEIKKSN